MIYKLNILILSFLLLMTQNLTAQSNDDHAADWKQVENYDKQGLTKSAQKIVSDIFKKAVASNNSVQQVKTAMYLMKYRNMIEEESASKNIFYLDSLIPKTTSPAKNILQSMQAEILHNYKENNRYRFYNRTALQEEKSTDVTTWSISKLNETIKTYFLQSLENEQILKTTSTVAFLPILEKGQNNEGLRPTLYDLLANRAINFFSNPENDITEPSYKFVIKDEAYFALAASFVTLNISSKDSTSFYLQSLKLFQRLIKFHLGDIDKTALNDINLLRLKFVADHGVFQNKDALFIAALKEIASNYPNSEAGAEAIYLIAERLYNAGQSYNASGDTNNRYALVEAAKKLQTIIEKNPKTIAAKKAANILAQIKATELTAQVEKVNSIGQPFRSLLSFKNLSRVYLQIIPFSRKEYNDIKNEYGNEWIKIIEKKTALKKWQQALPDTKDYQRHSIEIKIDALPSGTYMMVLSSKEKLSDDNVVVAGQLIHVSNISTINSGSEYLYVVDRNTGEPLRNATVQSCTNEYNYTTRKNIEVAATKYTTDNNGVVKLVKQNDERRGNVIFQIKTNNDELFEDEGIYLYNYNRNIIIKDRNETFLFTDRSIYRPGQKVYFKGIVVTKFGDGKDTKPAKSFKTKILVFDANNQKQNSITVTTNEYGSYNGSFDLPQGLLNGNFTLRDSTTQSVMSFSVEEYKRPKFEVEIKKPEGTYKVNDSITVTGNVKSYAGNTIDGAKVSYRVVRRVQYPIWWGWSKSIYNRGEQVEIANGISETDAEGMFKITFKALPDEKAEKKNQPKFYYDVMADVTDANGETRSNTTTIIVAYQALVININGGEKIQTKNISKINVSSTNINGVAEPTKADIMISQLNAPDKIFRKRYWSKPDVFVLSKQEYYAFFPYDVYDDEDEPANFPVKQIVYGQTISTDTAGNWHLPDLKLADGWYKINVTTTDKYGEIVKAEKIIELISDKGSNTSPLSIIKDKETSEPGEKLTVKYSTAFKKIWVNEILTKVGDRQTNQFLTITDNSPYKKQIDIEEKDRGGMFLNVFFVKNNRLYNYQEAIIIPWTNKELKIEYTSFRDKVLPGSEEKWSIKITGDKADKINAEALISLYDASLDQFKPQSWSSLSSLWPTVKSGVRISSHNFKSIILNNIRNADSKYKEFPQVVYKDLIRNGWEWTAQIRSLAYSSARREDMSLEKIHPQAMASENVLDEVVMKSGAMNDSAVTIVEIKSEESENLVFSKPLSPVQLRTNLNETAFFFPDLHTNEKGEISFSFTMPEALTRWKMMTLAHTATLASAYSERTLITQKPLFIQPNAPRFMREGDAMEFSAKVVNVTDKEITGVASLELIDAMTNKPIDGLFQNVFPNQYFTVAAGQSSVVKFPINIATNFNSAVYYKVTAVSTTKDSTGNTYSDGEASTLPVLSNRILVTETLPINLRNTNSKSFSFDKLKNSEQNSATLTHQSITVEYSTNPAWYAVQALPYLMEFPYECAEQNFNRYYANTIASNIVRSMPKIKAVFDKWAAKENTSNDALLSNLQKNEELKYAMLQETPWVMAAQNENEQKKNIGLLFNTIKLAAQADKTFNKIKEMQSPNGGFSWFKGGRDDRYITQYIITGIGHLMQLKMLSSTDLDKLQTIINNALPYLDARITDDYNNLIKYKAKLTENNLSQTAIQYLYMRSFFKGKDVTANNKTAYDYYYGQEKKYWLSQSKYMQAMIALTQNRSADAVTANAIIKSLQENAIVNEEMGMYWKELNTGGYYWYQAPIESQALLIEAFSEITKNDAIVNDLKTWLLKQKQTQNWKSTKATAEACYVLLLTGSDWLAEEKNVTIQLGNTVIQSTENAEPGTGYFKQKIAGEKVIPEMGNIKVTLNNTTSASKQSTSWGAVYWQYFEDLDKVTTAATPLKLTKRLYVEKNSDKGPILVELKDDASLKVGDKIKVRIELKADRDMEYVHMKDMRAAGTEPVNVISQYKYQDGLGYYESTKDASTNFFFSWLPKGTYIFEYPMFVTHTGDFSNGITTIQCMYAPEFMSHSEGVRIKVME